MKKFLISIILTFLLIASPASAEYFSDVIVTSPDGFWTDSRAYTTLNAAVAAVGANDREIVIVSPQVVTTLTVPSNVRLKFLRNGSITNSGQLTINTKNIFAGNRRIFTGVGNIDFADGTVVKTGWFGNIEGAFALTVNDTVTLIVSKPQIITADYSPGNNVNLKWDSPGNILTINPGVEVGNIKNIEAGNYQIFAGAGDFDFLDGIELNLKWFNRLSSALAWVESEKVTIIVNESSIVQANVTAASNEHIKVVSGGELVPDGGVTLTINSFEAGFYQVISGAGSVVFSSEIRSVYPEWWYSGSGTYTTAIQAAVDSLTSGGVVQLSSNTYSLTTTVNLADDIKIVGSGWTSRITRLAAETIYAFTGLGDDRVTIKNLWIDTIGSISMTDCDDIRIEGNKVTNTTFGYDGLGYYSGHRISILNNLVDFTSSGGGLTVQGDGSSDLQDVIVRGNTIKSVYEDGIVVRAFNGDATRVIVEGNNLYDIGKHGIQCSIGIGAVDTRTYEGIVIANNNITGWGKNDGSQGITVQATNTPTTYRIKNVAVTGNNIESLDTSTRVENNYIEMDYIEGGTCVGNTGRSGTDNSGIALSNIKDLTIANNFIELAAQNHAGGSIDEKAGIVLFQTYFSTVSGNVVKNTGTTTKNRPGIFVWNSQDNIIQGNICHDDQVIPTQSWGIQERESGAGGQIDRNYYIANKEYLNVEGDEDLVKTLTYQGLSLNPFTEVLTASGAGCAAGTTAGNAKTVNTVNFRFRSKVSSRVAIDDFWDLTGVATGAGQYMKVLLCINTAGAAVIVESKIASNQARANIPKRPDTCIVALGFVEIDQNYAGGALAGNFYDLWTW